jgi:hypothetical protein
MPIFLREDDLAHEGFILIHFILLHDTPHIPSLTDSLET